jgi:peptidoglycan/LPS O-acetylase OafA/YrhL
MKISYRPEIDGLRAVAVAVVLLYHAEFAVGGTTFLQGGYLGVDIFFVISGYLISKIILSELEQTGQFSFQNFYERRARRILPILLTVMIASFPFAWQYLLPQAFEEYARSILSSLLFFSNHYFSNVTTAYGADSSLLKPFLHTWSLSVEEQFYIVFPAMLILIYRKARKHLGLFTLVCIAVSLQFSETFGQSNPKLNFYFLPSRFWELASGSLLAILDLKYSRARYPLLSRTMPTFGAVLVGLSVAVFDGSTGHPGFATLALVFGTALVVFFANVKEPVGRILSTRAFVGTGLISYGLYLWHFPIFAFGRILNFEVSERDKVVWIGLAVGLAVVSYFVIERPFRQQQKLPIKYVAILISCATAVSTIFASSVLIADGFSSRLPPQFLETALGKNYWKFSDESGLQCHERKSGFCRFGNENAQPPIVLLGDSHAATLAERLVEKYNDGRGVLLMTASHCWPVLGVDFILKRTGKPYPRCTSEAQRNRFSEIEELPATTVVVAGRLPLMLSGKFFDNQEGGFETREDGNGYFIDYAIEDKSSLEVKIIESLKYLLQMGHSIILVYPIVENGWHVPDRLFQDMPKQVDRIHEFFSRGTVTTSYEIYLNRTKNSFELLDGLQHERVYRVYPHKLVCDLQEKGRCISHIGADILYADDNHPSAKGAAMINNLIIEKINDIEAKRGAQAVANGG